MIAASSKSVIRLRVVLVLACLAVSGLAEQPMLEKDYMDQFLREHNISNTKEAVTEALSNNDAAVRRGPRTFYQGDGQKMRRRRFKKLCCERRKG